jgi:hypothetical protein
MFASLSGFLLRLKSPVRRKRLDREFSGELEFHQALMQEKLVRQGVPQSRAAYEVRRSFATRPGGRSVYARSGNFTS